MADLSLALLFILSAAVAPLTIAGGAGDTTSFVYVGCSQPKYVAGSPYEYNVDSLLSSLANAAGFTLYANFTASAASPSAPAAGLFQCRADLPISTCTSCVRSALSQISGLCPSAAGAAVQLSGCFLRYGKDSFIGRPDTTLLYSKCGGAAGNGGYGPDLLGMRDAALAAMQAAPPQQGTYRVGGAGYVQALTQCVGDLSGKECGDCVSAAATQLRSACGFAVSGDVYLGKCYARFWSNGGYSSSHSNGGDEAGKTLAIIIGLMAGVALIIVFLSFIRRTEEGK